MQEHTFHMQTNPSPVYACHHPLSRSHTKPGCPLRYITPGPDKPCSPEPANIIQTSQSSTSSPSLPSLSVETPIKILV